MNLKLLPVLFVLCLSACGTHIVKDDAPASDLDVLRANVRKTTTPTLLPSGKEYCAELAVTEDANDDCTGDLEDALFTANRKAELTWDTVSKFIHDELQRRLPCGFFARVFSARCKNSATP